MRVLKTACGIALTKKSTLSVITGTFLSYAQVGFCILVAFS